MAFIGRAAILTSYLTDDSPAAGPGELVGILGDRSPVTTPS